MPAATPLLYFQTLFQHKSQHEVSVPNYFNTEPQSNIQRARSTSLPMILALCDMRADTNFKGSDSRYPSGLIVILWYQRFDWLTFSSHLNYNACSQASINMESDFASSPTSRSNKWSEILYFDILLVCL